MKFLVVILLLLHFALSITHRETTMLKVQDKNNKLYFTKEESVVVEAETDPKNKNGSKEVVNHDKVKEEGKKEKVEGKVGEKIETKKEEHVNEIKTPKVELKLEPNSGEKPQASLLKKDGMISPKILETKPKEELKQETNIEEKPQASLLKKDGMISPKILEMKPKEEEKKVEEKQTLKKDGMISPKILETKAEEEKKEINFDENSESGSISYRKPIIKGQEKEEIPSKIAKNEEKIIPAESQKASEVTSDSDQVEETKIRSKVPEKKKELPNYLKSRRDFSSDGKSGSFRTNWKNDPLVYKGNCFIKIRSKLYDLNPLSKDQKNKELLYSLKDQKGNDVVFSICRNIARNECASSKPSLIASKSSSGCQPLAGSYKMDKIWNIKRDSYNVTSLVLNLPTGGNCGAGKPYTTQFVIECDSKVKGLQIHNNQVFNTENCNNTIVMSSPHACSVGNFYSWWSYIPLNKWIIGLILFLIGIYLALFGFKHFKTTSPVFIAGCTGFILHGLFQPVFPQMPLIDFMIIGVIYGIVVYIFPDQLNNYSVGVIFGYILGNFVFNLIVPLIPIDPVILFYAVILGFIVPIFICFAWRFKGTLIIFVTSIIGCYISVRGIATIIGSFPDESYVAILAEHFEFNQIARLYSGDSFIYIIAMGVLIVVSVYTQFIMNPDVNEDRQNATAIDGVTSGTNEKIEKEGKNEKNDIEGNNNAAASLPADAK